MFKGKIVYSASQWHTTLRHFILLCVWIEFLTTFTCCICSEGRAKEVISWKEFLLCLR